MRRCAVFAALFSAVLLWLAAPLLAESSRVRPQSKFDGTITRCRRHKNGAGKLSEYTMAPQVAERIPKRLKKRGGFSFLGHSVLAKEPDSPPVNLLITTDDNGRKLQELLREKGGFINSKHGRVCSVLAYYDHLEDIAALDSVKHIGASRPMDILLDTARQPEGINLAAAGTKINKEIYKDFTGKGVLIGVIDTGIDVQHAAFKDKDGKSRILAYWNQNESGQEITVRVPPLEEGGAWEERTYNYGREYTNEDIDAGAAPRGVQNHGTHVASIAGGSLADYPGVAPEASFIMVDAVYKNGSGFTANGLLDGVEYLIAKAKELDMPLVVNMSLGGYDEFCDGTALFDLALQADIESPERRLIVCVSAGNNGKHPYPLVLGDSGTVTLKHTPYSLYDDEAEAEGPGLIVVTPYDPEAAVTVETFADAACTEKIATVVRNHSLFASGWMDEERTFKLDGCLYNKDREAVSADGPEPPATIYAEIVGSIPRDVYCRYTFHHCDLNGSTRISPYEYYSDSQGGLASFAAVNPRIGGTLTTPGTAPGAITVGAYSDADRGLCAFSSCGPPRLRDRYEGLNYYKPDICAPGYSITAALPSWTSSAGTGSKNGTSMASPMTAGMVALMLQKCPDFTAADVKERLFSGARLDMCTGSAANDAWGHGKLDACSLPTETPSILNVSACGDSSSYAYVYVANASDPEPRIAINGQDCDVCEYAPDADVYSTKAVKVSVNPELGAFLNGSAAGLSRTYSFVYKGSSGDSPAYTIRKTFKISQLENDFSSIYVKLDDSGITDGCLYINGSACSVSYFAWNNAFCVAVQLPDELKSYIAGYTDTLSRDYRLQFAAGDGRQSEVLLLRRNMPVDEVDAPAIKRISVDSSRSDSCVYVYTNGYCGASVSVNGASPNNVMYSAAKKAYRLQVPGELYRFLAGEDGALSRDYVIAVGGSSGSKDSRTFTAVRDLRPCITSVAAEFSIAAVSVKDCAGCGDEAGQAVLRLNGKALNAAYYSNSYGAHFEANVPDELFRYLKTGVKPAQTYRFEVVSDAGTVSAPWIAVGSNRPQYAVTGYEIEEENRSILISGQGFTALTKIVFAGRTYEAEFISDTQVRIKDVPEEIIETVLIGQDKGAGIVYNLTASMSGGYSAVYEIVPKEKLLITEVGSSDGECLTLTLSDEKIVGDGSCYINGRRYDAWYQASERQFVIYSSEYSELASFCQNWTDTLSRDYTLKFVSAEGRESLELQYQRVIPETDAEPVLEGVDADCDSHCRHIAYVRTSGYGGVLQINGETPRYALYSQEKSAYRVPVPYELGRYLLNQDGALSRDYVFTLTSESGAEISSCTLKAQRSLQPCIVGVSAAHSDGGAAYADVYVRNCPACGDEVGLAMVQINGEKPAEHVYCGSAACAYFRISVPDELYAYLQGEQTSLEREYHLTVVSDAGIVSEARVFPYRSGCDYQASQPLITGVSAGSSNAEAVVSVEHCQGGTLYINGVRAESRYDDEKQAFAAAVDYQLGAYLSGTAKSLAQNYVLRVKAADGAVSEPYAIAKAVPVKPVIKGVKMYSSGSTSYAYLQVSGCTAGTAYMDGIKRSTCKYSSSQKAFKINVSSEVGRYLTKKSSVLPNSHTFKIVSADGVSSSVYTLKANTAKPVISKITKYSSSSTIYAYVYCSNCTSGSAVYVNGTKRTSSYVSGKKAFKVKIPTELGKYLNGSSKTLARNYSFKVVNKKGAISSVKTILAVSDKPQITSVGKYSSGYVYVYVKNCASSAKIYVNGSAASRSFVASKNAFKVKVPSALGNYYLDKLKGLPRDYVFKIVSGGKTGPLFVVKQAAATPVVVQVLPGAGSSADVYVSGITTGGTVSLDGCAAVHGSSYSAAKKAFTAVVVPAELAAYLRGESAFLSRDYTFTVKSSQGKTSAAKTIAAVYPKTLPVINAVLPDSGDWLKLRVDSCRAGDVYVNGAAAPSFCEGDYFYVLVAAELAEFVRGQRDDLPETYSVRVVRRDGKSSAAVAISSSRRPAITRVAGSPGFSEWCSVYLDRDVSGTVLVNGIEAAAARTQLTNGVSVAVPAELAAFLNGESSVLRQDYAFQFVADGGLSSMMYVIKATADGGESADMPDADSSDAADTERELNQINEELLAEAAANGVPAPAEITLSELTPLLLNTEEAREAVEERVEQMKAELLRDESEDGGDEDEDTAAENADDEQQNQDCEDPLSDQLDLSLTGDDGGLGRQSAYAESDGIDEAAETAEFPEDAAACRSGGTEASGCVPRIAAVRAGADMESWSVWGSNFTPDSVVYIDGLPYYPEVLSDHNLVIPAVAETAQAKLDGGERVSVLVLCRTAEDDELRTVSSSVYFAGAEVE